jgi:hypothetical protein
MFDFTPKLQDTLLTSDLLQFHQNERELIRQGDWLLPT